MEIRTDFTALVLPSDSELALAAERARLVSEEQLPRRLHVSLLRRWFGGAPSREAVAR